MLEIKNNEIILFTFKIEDKAKIYSHMKKNGIVISLLTYERTLGGIYIPIISIFQKNPFVNPSTVQKIANFMEALRKNNIEFIFRYYELKQQDIHSMRPEDNISGKEKSSLISNTY